MTLHADAKPLGRQVALFTAVLGLADRLRSVFVPYFRYLLDPIAAHLGGTGSDGERHKRKKKKKSSTAVVAVADESSDEPSVVEDTWQLRYKVCYILKRHSLDKPTANTANVACSCQQLTFAIDSLLQHWQVGCCAVSFENWLLAIVFYHDKESICILLPTVPYELTCFVQTVSGQA